MAAHLHITLNMEFVISPGFCLLQSRLPGGEPGAHIRLNVSVVWWARYRAGMTQERNPESEGTSVLLERALCLLGRVIASITFLRTTRWQSKEDTEMLNQVHIQDQRGKQGG